MKTDKDIVTRIDAECDAIESLTYAELTGLLDGEDEEGFDQKLAVCGYQENAICGVFSEIAREEGTTFEEIEAIWNKANDINRRK